MKFSRCGHVHGQRFHTNDIRVTLGEKTTEGGRGGGSIDGGGGGGGGGTRCVRSEVKEVRYIFPLVGKRKRK